MIKLEIGDKKYKIPEGFDELTLEDYCRIFFKLPKFDDNLDDIDRYRLTRETEAIILSRLLGEGDDFCYSLPLNVYSVLRERTKFIYDIDRIMKSSRAGIVIGKKFYSIPPFNEMSLRQYIDADVVLHEEESNLQYIELLSILLSTKDDRGKWIPYNGEYQELMGKVRSLKCSEALGLVYHFFKKGEVLRRLSEASMKVVESQHHQHIPNS